PARAVRGTAGMARTVRPRSLRCEGRDEADEEGETMTRQGRKMSEMISEMAGAFIEVGKTAAEKQSRLTAACSAWNMACGSSEIRQRQLEQYVEGYQRFNSATSP